MADSVILAAEKALTTHLETYLTPAEGSSFDMTDRVFRGRVRFGSEPIPMLSLIQAPEIDIETLGAGQGIKRSEGKLYNIQGWVEDDVANPTDPAHALMAEVKKALSRIVDPDSEQYMLKNQNPSGRGMFSELDVSMGLVRPPEQGISDKAYFWLPVRIGFVEILSDPYALP